MESWTKFVVAFIFLSLILGEIVYSAIFPRRGILDSHYHMFDYVLIYHINIDTYLNIIMQIMYLVNIP